MLNERRVKDGATVEVQDEQMQKQKKKKFRFEVADRILSHEVHNILGSAK